MNYLKIYNDLIAKSFSEEEKIKKSYFETHHILPRSLGGKDSRENLIKLTARQHFLAHLLLAKIYDNLQMWSAIQYMADTRYTNLCLKHRLSAGLKINSKIYECIRKKCSKMRKEFNKTHKPKSCKPVLQYDLNGNFIKEYVSVREAVRAFAKGNSQTAGILKNCKYNTYDSVTSQALGYVWLYKTSDDFPKKIASYKQCEENAKKPVLQYDLNGNFIAEYPSRYEAACKTGCCPGSILGCINGKLKSTNNFIWTRKDSDDFPTKIDPYVKKSLKGIKKSEDAKKKMADSAKSKKAVRQYTKSGEFVAEYSSIHEAERKTGIYHSHISRCCLGKIKSAGGFVWKFVQNTV